jgi:hypothetical protein
VFRGRVRASVLVVAVQGTVVAALIAHSLTGNARPPAGTSADASIEQAPPDDCEAAGINDEGLFCYKSSQGSELDVSAQLGLLFQMDDYLATCGSVFETPQIKSAFFKVDAWNTPLAPDHFRQEFEHPPAMPSGFVDSGEGWTTFFRRGVLRGSLWKLYNAVKRWRHVPITKVDAAGMVNAEISPLDSEGKSAGVTFFGSACAPTKIYGADLSWLDAQTRYMFVAAHEMGHLVDFWAGDTPVLGRSSIEIEQRATIYGSYFAECWLRVLEYTYSRLLRSDASATAPSGVAWFATQHDVECAIANWRKAERAMTRQRLEWEQQTWSVQEPSVLAVSGACRSPLPVGPDAATPVGTGERAGTPWTTIR